MTAESAWADGFIVVDRRVIIDPHPHPRHPHFPPPRPPRPIQQFMPLEVRQHHVDVQIDGQVAVTKVDQTFYNPSGQRLEGTYLFPIPKGAEIDKFEMDVNGEMMEAELLDAKKARGIYEDIVRRAKDPALMEYAGQGLFKVRIFPIEPRSEKRVKLKYTQVVKKDGRIAEYVYPLNTEKFSSRPIKSVALKAEIKSDHIIKSVYSPSHDVDVNRKGDHRVTVGFELSNSKPDTDFQLFYALDSADGDPIGLELLTYRDKKRKRDEGGYFMLLVSPGAWEKRGKVVEKDVVFVVDTSGSMRVKKLDQAKAALDFCLDSLNEGDRFDIIRYSTEAEAVFGELVAADEDNVGEGREFVEGMKAGGGTAIEEALLLALGHAKERSGKDRPYQVIFLTDGRPTIGETKPEKILSRFEDKLKGIDTDVRVFCFGIGTNINTKLLDQVAGKTRAVTEYVLPEEDIEHKVGRFYSKIAQPVMTRLKIRTKGGIRLSKRYPTDLPDLFKGDQLVVLGRYNHRDDDEKPRIILEGSVGGKKKTFTYKGKFPEKATDHTFIPRLWGTRRVGYLLNEIRLRGETDETKEEVVALARKYGIVTPYTSYLIVEDEEGRNVPERRRSVQLNRFNAPRTGIADDGAPRGGRDATDGFGGGGFAPPAPEELAARNKRAYDGLRTEESGDASVAAAQATRKLSEAKTRADLEMAFQYSQLGSAPGKVVVRQASKEVAGKTFFDNGGLWVDGEVAEETDAKIVKVAFGSDAYFELLAKSAEVAKWLSVGVRVQVLVDATVYEITEAEVEAE